MPQITLDNELYLISDTFIHFTEFVITWVIFTFTNILSHFYGRSIERGTEGQESFQDHRKHKPLLCLLPLSVNCPITWRERPPSTPVTAGPDPPSFLAMISTRMPRRHWCNTHMDMSVTYFSNYTSDMQLVFTLCLIWPFCS